MNSMIRFKEFAFEHNPETLKITTSKNIINRNVIGSKSAVFETGDNSRVITGEGKIHGQNCIYKFLKLFRLKEERGSGILSLPDMKPFYAFFSSLEFSADPTPELISYKFTFIEDSLRQELPVASERFYELGEGEDLWDAAYKFGVSVETLVGLNPEIRRVDEPGEGTKVRIC